MRERDKERERERERMRGGGTGNSFLLFYFLIELRPDSTGSKQWHRDTQYDDI